MLLQQVRAAALRAGLGHRFVRRGELALGIMSATVERRAARARRLLDQFDAALGALHADEVLLHVLAFRIAAAGDELAVAPVPQHHVAVTLRTLFVQRN